MEQDNGKTEIDNAASEKLLGDVVEAAEDAIHAGTGKSEEQRAEVYRLALHNLSTLLGGGTVYEPTAGTGVFRTPKEIKAKIAREAIMDASGQKRTVVSLPDLYTESRERFGHVFGVWVRPAGGGFAGTLFRDDVRILDMHTPCGKEKCRRMILGALKEYCRKQESRKRRKVTKKLFQEIRHPKGSAK